MNQSLFIRYFLLILLGLGNFYIFYLIFTPLTLYATLIILNIFSTSFLVSSTSIFFNGLEISLIKACIAGSAYYLLTILNLATPMKDKTRVYSLLFLLGAFFFLNTIRIVIFSFLASTNFYYFDVAHQISWHLGSTFLVLAIWIINIKMFKIKEIPFYTDWRKLIKNYKHAK